MTATITAATGIVQAFAVLSTSKTKQEARTRRHDILDGPPVFTVRDASSREAKMEFYVATQAAAETLRVIFATGQVATVADAEQPWLLSPIVLVGDLTKELDKKTAKLWVVTAEVAEVP